ncbi:uncharacterized protein LOC131306812 [Rhododendron vialii]|uniref:uncharacterized protein LOC131306812 n=1 Tax=Rhododendron vialii TaxID=182163 RepID=UPI002660343D|nr:uncharacterized protein LOC131306812 [Rhododendron vialii]
MYERPDTDWAKVVAYKTKEHEDRTMTALEAAWKAISNIAASPFARKLQEAQLLSRVKHGWRQLAEEFTTQFLTSRRAPKMFESLSTMKQGESEPIRDYAKKYWETFNEIESCSKEYAIATFKTGLPVRGELRQSLNMNPVAMLAKLMERIEQHARMEDDILCEDGKIVAEQTKGPTKKVDKPEPKTYRERKKYRQAKKEPCKERQVPDPKSFFQ